MIKRKIDQVKRKVAKKRFQPVTSSKEIKFLTDGEMVDINSLKLWKDNPRYNQEAVPKLAKLFKDHGVRSNIVVWRKNSTIYKGNTTFKALKLLGCKEIPVSFQDFPSEAAAKAYGISDNKSSEYAGWDEDVLLDIMKADEMGPLKQSTGFKETEIDKMKRNKAGDTVDVTATNYFKCVISYHPSVKEDLKAYLAKTVARKFGTNIVLKFI